MLVPLSAAKDPGIYFQKVMQGCFAEFTLSRMRRSFSRDRGIRTTVKGSACKIATFQQALEGCKLQRDRRLDRAGRISRGRAPAHMANRSLIVNYERGAFGDAE
jgi:hypothetical protein